MLSQKYVFEKLVEKKYFDVDLQIGTAKDFAYELNPSIGLNELEAVETRFGCRLPDDYRHFLLTIGNGGAGPGYGLFSLEKALEYGGDLSKPFRRPDAPYDPEANDRDGLLMLSTSGCAYDDFLVTGGKERGYVWSWIERSNNAYGLVPTIKKVRPYGSGSDAAWIQQFYDAPDSEKETFSQWYDNWLNAPIALDIYSDRVKKVSAGWWEKFWRLV